MSTKNKYLWTVLFFFQVSDPLFEEKTTTHTVSPVYWPENFRVSLKAEKKVWVRYFSLVTSKPSKLSDPKENQILLLSTLFNDAYTRCLRIVVDLQTSFLHKSLPYYASTLDMRKLAEWLHMKNSRNFREVLPTTSYLLHSDVWSELGIIYIYEYLNWNCVNRAIRNIVR